MRVRIEPTWPSSLLCTSVAKRILFILHKKDLAGVLIIPSTLRPSHRLLTEEIARVHLEHLECSHKPRTQGRGAKKRNPAGQMLEIGVRARSREEP